MKERKTASLLPSMHLFHWQGSGKGHGSRTEPVKSPSEAAPRQEVEEGGGGAGGGEGSEISPSPHQLNWLSQDAATKLAATLASLLFSQRGQTAQQWPSIIIIIGLICGVVVPVVLLLTQRPFWTRSVHRVSPLRGRPLDPSDQPGLADVHLPTGSGRRRGVWPAGDRHGGRDWPKVGVLVDGADGAGGGRHRARGGGAGGGGQRSPRRKSGSHLGGGQRT